MELVTTTIMTPIGSLTVAATATGLSFTGFDEPVPTRYAGSSGPAAEQTLAHAVDELEAYFAGRLRTFTVPIDLDRSSPFARTVLGAVAAVPFGATTTYGALATGMGRPTAVRAVGRANATNPVCLVVPCHRVVGADGSLTGYAFGLDRKRWLLDHEAGR
jgi:methylated-DNA-[protein]-cysteine S-methyltransferase